MKVLETPLEGVLVIEPAIFRDDRGFFLETFQRDRYAAAGVPTTFVQDNVSQSKRHTLRGLHFQEPHAQGKLVQVSRGSVLDVVVDIRRGSPTFGKSYATELSEDNRRQMWIPAGFAHGFCVTSELAEFHYKCTDVYAREASHTIVWNDPDLCIEWPVTAPLLSPQDVAAPRLRDAKVLPEYRGTGVLSRTAP